MKGYPQDITLKNLEAFLREGERWATLSVSIDEMAKEIRPVISDLLRYDTKTTIPLLASLLTLPEYQSNCIRLEILLALSVAYCSGTKKPKIQDVARWFSRIGHSKCVSGEDPAEDVFVSLVSSSSGNYKILEGVWESAGFYTQQIINVVESMPNRSDFSLIKRRIKSMLILSDLICTRANLGRYQLGNEIACSRINVGKCPSKLNLLSRVTFSFKELLDLGVNIEELEPFLFHQTMRSDLRSQQVGNSLLEKRPLCVLTPEHLSIILPTAISVSIRQFVIDCMTRDSLASTFDSALANTYARLISETPLLGGRLHAPVNWESTEHSKHSNFGLMVDEGFYYVYHLFLPSIEMHNPGGFKGLINGEGDITDRMTKDIDTAISEFSKKSGFKHGLVVLVGCGWGKGYARGEIEFNHPNWRFETLPISDLIRLSWLGEMDPGYFWRIQDGLTEIKKNGVVISNANGVLNLIGWVQSNDGHFVPHAQLVDGEISPDRGVIMNIPTNLLRNVRAGSDCGFDRHCVIDNLGEWHEVRYLSASPFFVSDSSKKLYVSHTDVERGRLTSVYEGSVNLWVTLVADRIEDKDLEFRLWEMAHEWIHRIGSILDSKFEKLTEIVSLKVIVEFHDGDLPKQQKFKPLQSELESFCEVKESDEKWAMTAVFREGFLSGFGVSENIAERIFVRNVLSAVLRMLGEKEEGIVRSLEESVVTNLSARSFHLFQAQNFSHYVRQSLPKDLIESDSINDGIAKLMLGWRAIDSIGEPRANRIVGKEKCTRLLNAAVDILISEISDSLSVFDRNSMVTKLVINCENASAKEDNWKRTSAAVLGLHGSSESTLRRYVEQTSRFAGSAISSRVLIEMALCICPIMGGALPSDIEARRILARSSLVIRFGGLSDAIKFNALPPELHISAFGDILLNDAFGDDVVHPMLSRVSSEKFIEIAPKQLKNYESPDVVESTREFFGDEFWRIWVDEVGFSPDEGRLIVEVLEERGIENVQAVFQLRKSEYFSLTAAGNVRQSAAEGFLLQFTLANREKWDVVPAGFDVDDIYPWRFGRRLSYVTRPILKIDSSEDPILLIAPASLRKALAYVIEGAFYGRFKQSFFRTARMRNDWWGKASEGHTFNMRAAETLRENGWVVRTNIGLPEILKKKLDRDYGDIDILAWRTDENRILVIECKDLAFARNYSEVAVLLSNFQGMLDEKGKGDRLRVHLDRVAVMEENLDEAIKFTGVVGAQISSYLVFSGVVPMQYASIDALRSTSVSTMDALIASLKR